METKGEDTVEQTFLPTNEEIVIENMTDIEVPDGGWGWVIVFATLTFNVIYDGCNFSFGILYTQLLDYFGDTKSNTAWIGSFFSSVPLLFAPMAGIITRKLGSRKATMLGGVISSLGFAIGSFSNSVPMLIFLYGFVGGFGMSLPYFNSFKTVTDYFDKRLALASGIAESGAGLGTVIFAPFTEFLVTFGWRGTLLILSGVVANIVVCGALYRPVERGRKVNSDVAILNTEVPSEEETEMCIDPTENRHSNESISLALDTANPSRECTRQVESRLNTQAPLINDEEILSMERQQNGASYRSRLFSVPFVIFAISNFTMYFWYDVPYVFLVDRSVSFGMTTQKASYLLSIIGFVHLFSILGYGILGDKKNVNRAIVYGLSTAFCGISILLIPFFKHFSVHAILSGSFGLFSAATEALLSCVLIDIVGKKAFDNFFCGLILFMEGVANLIGPPFAGFLFDCTGTYDATFYTAGACVFTAGILYVTLSKVNKERG